MRVFNYGEPGNDWLELDIKRVQNKQWFSNNQNIGFIYLDSANSTKLIEKTDREGFIENETFNIFYQSIVAILNDFRIERIKDRTKLLTYLKPVSKSFSHIDNVALFKDLIDSTDFSVDEQKTILKDEADKLQKDFETKKETLLIPAGVGMTASVALHEMEKLVPTRMKEVINTIPFKKDLANDLIDELDDYLKGILSVLRKGGNKPIDLKDSINKAVSNYSSKLNRRNISIELSFDDNIDTIKCEQRYFITMIMNIIDNSIYWLDTIYKNNKGIYIKTYIEDNFVSILLIDNGPGFKDDITDIVRPFFSRKEDGIGIGLYLIDTIMMKYGKLEIIDSEEELDNLEIPKKYRGAAVKLTFRKKQ
jgi:K+-sensing histidine kinase KdpD